MHTRSSQTAEQAQSNADVLVLGAGIAGLAAARALSERGRRVLVLEARHRVGGRIVSQRIEDRITVELGAEFVHGRAPELWQLIEESGANTVERDGAMLRERTDGTLAEDEDTEDGDRLSPLVSLAHLAGDDLPFADWLRTSDVPADQRTALLGYVEGFNAADASRISARALGIQQQGEEQIEGGRAWHVREGYAQLPQYLAHRVRQLGSEIRLRWVVEAVRWSDHDVHVETTCGTFRAPQCIVTLPLGVLQNGVAFTPEPRAIAAARRLAMGHAARFTMIFRERWWENSPRLYPDVLQDWSFLFTPGRMPNVWWTTHPEKQELPTITGWVGGPAAAALASRSAEELGRDACHSLASVFSVPEERVATALLATCTHDWSRDPFARGAYSYVPAGALAAPAAMSQPEAGTIFFAGEHTDTTGHWGTVHAALRSGLRAASQVLAADLSR